MQRWNGWGEPGITAPLPEAVARLLRARLGPGVPTPDASFEAVQAAVPPSRLPSHPLVDTTAASRVYHARGQSFSDWVALRAGRLGALPDGVAFPTSRDEVRALIEYAQREGVLLIPYGGGTSVVGHINPPVSERPVLTVSMARRNQVIRIDATSGHASFGAGISGAQLEAALRACGLTLGHFPQSFEYSTLGGWVATRSSGQQSMGYGRIEEMFLGAHVETPQGPMALPPLPASAAGPDLRHLLLGSEGRLGIIDEVTVRCRRLPEVESFHALWFPSWEAGVGAVRDLVQQHTPLSMIRLSTARESTNTVTTALGHGWWQRLLPLWQEGAGWCLAIVGYGGTAAVVRAAQQAVGARVRAAGGRVLGPWLGKQWQKSRFRSPYLRNTLWELGYGVDTLETATTWENVSPLVARIEGALAGTGERVYAFTHLSHLYPAGSSIYTTYLFPLAKEPTETLARWSRFKGAASEAIVAHGGTISHQHGVGVDHAPYLPAEKGALGMSTLRTLIHQMDPDGIMNPGKLLPEAMPPSEGA